MDEVTTCRKGLHDLSDPANVITRRWSGREDRLCGPCFREYQAAYHRRRSREARVPARPRTTPAQREEERLRFLQLVAEGRSISAASLAVGHSTTWGTRVARGAGVRSRFAPGEQEPPS